MYNEEPRACHNIHFVLKVDDHTTQSTSSPLLVFFLPKFRFFPPQNGSDFSLLLFDTSYIYTTNVNNL